MYGAVYKVVSVAFAINHEQIGILILGLLHDGFRIGSTLGCDLSAMTIFSMGMSVLPALPPVLPRP